MTVHSGSKDPLAQMTVQIAWLKWPSSLAQDRWLLEEPLNFKKSNFRPSNLDMKTNKGILWNRGHGNGHENFSHRGHGRGHGHWKFPDRGHERGHRHDLFKKSRTRTWRGLTADTRVYRSLQVTEMLARRQHFYLIHTTTSIELYFWSAQTAWSVKNHG